MPFQTTGQASRMEARAALHGVVSIHLPDRVKGCAIELVAGGRDAAALRAQPYAKHRLISTDFHKMTTLSLNNNGPRHAGALRHPRRVQRVPWQFSMGAEGARRVMVVGCGAGRALAGLPAPPAQREVAARHRRVACGLALTIVTRDSDELLTAARRARTAV